VGNDTREWRMGEAWAFDDTIEHEAWNDADETRVIMIFDIWNPLLSDAERDLARKLLTTHNAWLNS
jgi:aspartyl/asparaginyl beta-hydroxylase (cupin superfamily)